MLGEAGTRARSPTHFRLVTFDLRGHGMSEKPLGRRSTTRDGRLWADDLAAVIEQTGLERPVLVAWSYGGYVVTDYLARLRRRAHRRHRPGRRRGAAHARPSTTSGRACSRTPAMLRARPAANIAAIRRFLRACTVRPLDDDDWSTALCWNMVVPAEVRGALFAREIDGDDVLSRLSVPVLVTHGRADAIVLPSMAEHVLEVCPTARASWYDDVGHMPFWEDSDRFDRELAEFVEHRQRLEHGQHEAASLTGVDSGRAFGSAAPQSNRSPLRLPAGVHLPAQRPGSGFPLVHPWTVPHPRPARTQGSAGS